MSFSKSTSLSLSSSESISIKGGSFTFLDDLSPECQLAFFEGLTYKDQRLHRWPFILIDSNILIVSCASLVRRSVSSNVNMENDLSVAEFDPEIENII